MNRKIRVAGAAFAALAVVLVLSAPAIATTEIHSSAEHTILTLSPTSKYEFSAGTGFALVSCEAKSLEGTMSTSSETGSTWSSGVTEDTGCADSRGRAAHLKCTKNYHTQTTWWGWSHHWNCEGVTKIEITDSFSKTACTVTIPGQTLEGISATNESGKVNVKYNFTKVKSTTSGGLFNCGIADGEHTSGTFVGTALLSGTSTLGSPVELKVE